jgi:hypothetical protein
MMPNHVGLAPQRRVLRYRDDDGTARPQGCVDLCQYRPIFLDVLDNIKGADKVEFVPEWNLECVELDQRDILRHTPSGMDQADRLNL